MIEYIKYPEIDLNGVELVCIDIDDTLYLYERCHEIALNACAMQFTADGFPGPERFRDAYLEHRERVVARLSPQGVCRSRLLVFTEMFEELSLPMPYVLGMKYDRLYWDTFIDAMYPEEQALLFLQRAAAGSIPVVAVTDMLTEIQTRKIVRLGMEQLIAFLATSEAAGAEKPEPQIFRFALDKAGVSPDRAIMIGDNPSKDKLGADTLGIRFYHVEIAIVTSLG